MKLSRSTKKVKYSLVVIKIWFNTNTTKTYFIASTDFIAVTNQKARQKYGHKSINLKSVTND